MTHVVTLGETMALLSTPEIGLLRHANTMRVSVGGAESNLAIGLARLGKRVSWIGRVGDDEFGALVRRTLAAEGVDGRVRVDPGAPTGLMVKYRRTGTTTQVLYYRKGSAGSRLEPTDLDRDLIHGARVKLWSAEEAGRALAILVAHADVVFATEPEARLLVSGETPAELGLALAGFGPKQVVIKRGARGAVAVIGGEVLVVPAHEVIEVDPVGAGDAFAAGYLSTLLDGGDPAGCLATGALAGAYTVTVPGDWEGLPFPADLELLQAADGVVR
ncbi:MAG: sugar kinase [Actinobacteria bacterium]|nr:MAG: sugar kinase [Actinomycetota bacterium]